jgi:hypothetical protein
VPYKHRKHRIYIRDQCYSQAKKNVDRHNHNLDGGFGTPNGKPGKGYVWPDEEGVEDCFKNPHDHARRTHQSFSTSKSNRSKEGGEPLFWPRKPFVRGCILGRLALELACYEWIVHSHKDQQTTRRIETLIPEQ